MLLSALRRAVPIPRVDAFVRYLFVGPHPDDVEMGCAPTMRRLASAGKELRVVIVTDGAMGSSDPARAGPALAAIRRAEAKASAGLLGALEPEFLPFADGGLYAVEELARALAAEIVRARPEVVFSPDPDLASECHADHLKTGLAVKMAMTMAPNLALMRSLGVEGSWQPEALAMYYTDRPNAFVPVAATMSARREALLLHPSQFAPGALEDILRYQGIRARRLGLGRLRGPCDGYRVLGTLHRHCFPEVMEF